MPRPYPMPNITTSNQIIEHANTVTGGALTIMFMAACSIVLFILFRARFHRTSVSAMAASFLTLVLGSFIWAMGYLEGRIIILFLLITLASAIWSVFDQ